MEGQEGNCATVCGRTCTYYYQGSSYRDTDWYEATAVGGPVVMRGMAEFPYQMIFIYGTNCNNLLYDWLQADPCEEVELSHDMAAGALVWLWHGPAIFSGLPESDYVFTVCGIAGMPAGAPEERITTTTWGGIKARYSGAAVKRE